jgi:hypothetical protein
MLCGSSVFAKDYIITIPDELVPAIQKIVNDKIVEGKKDNPDYFLSEIDYLSGIMVTAAQSWATKQKDEQMLKYKEMLENSTPKVQTYLIGLLIQNSGG